MEAGAELKYKITKNLKDTKKLTMKKWDGPGLLTSGTEGKFYLSVINSEDSPLGGEATFGAGDCPNLQYRTSFTARDGNNKPVENVYITVQKTADSSFVASGSTDFTQYLYSGVYAVSGTIGGHEIRQTFRVDDTFQTVTLSPKTSDITVTLKLTDSETGDVIRDVVVTAKLDDLVIATATTNSKGYAYLRLPYAATCSQHSSYYITMAKDAYITDSFTLSAGSQDVTRNETLTPGKNGFGGFSGALVDSVTGKAVSGATVQLLEGKNATFGSAQVRTFTTSGSNGKFSRTATGVGILDLFAGISAGDYTLYITKEGYQPLYHSFILQGGQKVTSVGTLKMIPIN